MGLPRSITLTCHLQKGLPESEVTIKSPMELGGFKSDEYLAVNPHGKVPAIRCESLGLCIAESDTVARYLISTYASQGPSFQPDNPMSNQIARFHDVYLSSIQMCLYKVSASDPLLFWIQVVLKLVPIHKNLSYFCSTARPALWKYWISQRCPQGIFQATIYYFKLDQR